MGVMSSMYQLHGNSTSEAVVGAGAVGRGTIQLDADTEGEKSIGWMGGVGVRK